MTLQLSHLKSFGGQYTMSTRPNRINARYWEFTSPGYIEESTNPEPEVESRL